MKIAGCTSKGQVRKENQDAIYFDESRKVCVLADGMGGHNAGAVASRIAVEVFFSRIPGENPEEYLYGCFEEARRKIQEASERDSSLQGMGTTLTAAVLEEARISFLHLGDSRAYFFDGEKLEVLTDDHTVAGELLRNGSITEKDFRLHPHRNVLTKALGSSDKSAEPDCLVREWIGQMLLVCSDGLYNELDEKQISGILTEDIPLDAKAAKLCSGAVDAGGNDNVSVILVEK